MGPNDHTGTLISDLMAQAFAAMRRPTAAQWQAAKQRPTQFGDRKNIPQGTADFCLSIQRRPKGPLSYHWYCKICCRLTWHKEGKCLECLRLKRNAVT